MSAFESTQKIELSDIELALKTRFLLLKKGKKLGRTIVRWILFTKHSKFLYYKKFTDKQPSGCYSVY